MSSFLDFLRDKEHTGDPLAMSHQWPPPEGADFFQAGMIEEQDVATTYHGRLLTRNDEAVSTWTWATIVYPHHEDVIELALTCHGAMVQGGPKMIKYCKHQGCAFIALEAPDGFKSMGLKQYTQFRTDVGGQSTDEKERMESIAYELSRNVVNIHDGGIYHRDLGVHCVVISNFALKTTFGAGDVHLVGYERAGTVSNRFRNENMKKETGKADGKNEMSGAVEGDERLPRANDMLGHKLLPRIADPMALEFSQGLESQPLSRDVVGIVNEKMLDRYLLADTVFDMFGGEIGGPKPDRIPSDLYSFLTGLSTTDMTKRFHPQAELKKHEWMQRRAAIAAAVLEGKKPADIEPPVGQTMKTLWAPAKEKQASDTREARDSVNPVGSLARIVKGSERVGAAVLEAEAGAASPRPVAKVQQAPSGSPPGSWSRSGLGLPTVSESGSSPGSDWGSWADLEESERESDDGGGRSSPPSHEDKGVEKVMGKGEDIGEGKGLDGKREEESEHRADRSSPPFGMGKGLCAGKGKRKGGAVETGKGEERGEEESRGGGDRSSPPFGLGKGLWAGKGNGMVSETAEDEGERKDKDLQMTAEAGERTTPTRSTTVAAGISDLEEAGARSANTYRIGSTCKRKRCERDESSDGSDDTSPKRYRSFPKSEGGRPWREAPFVPEDVAAEVMAVPEGAIFIRPFMGSDIVEPYSPSDLYSIDENAYDDMQGCNSDVSNHGAGPYSASDIEEDIDNL